MKNLPDMLVILKKRAEHYHRNAKLQPKLMKKTAQNASNVAQVERKSESNIMTLHQDKNAVQSITEIISDCYDVQKTFGMSKKDLEEKITPIFLKLYANEKSAQVVNAFKHHLKHGAEFPTPKDITALIKRRA